MVSDSWRISIAVLQVSERVLNRTFFNSYTEKTRSLGLQISDGIIRVRLGHLWTQAIHLMLAGARPNDRTKRVECSSTANQHRNEDYRPAQVAAFRCRFLMKPAICSCLVTKKTRLASLRQTSTPMVSAKPAHSSYSRASRNSRKR